MSGTGDSETLTILIVRQRNGEYAAIDQANHDLGSPVGYGKTKACRHRRPHRPDGPTRPDRRSSRGVIHPVPAAGGWEGLLSCRFTACCSQGQVSERAIDVEADRIAGARRSGRTLALLQARCRTPGGRGCASTSSSAVTDRLHVVALPEERVGVAPGLATRRRRLPDLFRAACNAGRIADRVCDE